MGNLDALRDWGHAKDVEDDNAMDDLQQEKPDDFVISTGIQYSVRDFVNKTCEFLNIEVEWREEIEEEKAYDKNGKCIVEVDPVYFRPTRVEIYGRLFKSLHEILQWKPEISFDDLVKK